MEEPLLGGPAIEALEIVTVISAVHIIRDTDEQLFDSRKEISSLFQVIGIFRENYTMLLCKDNRCDKQD